MSQQPDISVVIASFNCGPFLAEAINSVLQQSGAAVEVIVVDDGSTDESSIVAASFGDKIVFERIGHSGRPSVPRNVGLRLAKADLIAIFDADDVMLHDKLQRSINVFRSVPDVSLLFTDFQAIDEVGSVVKPSFLGEYVTFRSCLRPMDGTNGFLANGQDVFRHLLASNFIGTSSVVARRAVIAECGGFDELLTNSDDVALWYRIARAGHLCAFLDEVLHSYRIRKGSISKGGSNRFPSVISVLRDQLSHVRSPVDRESVERRITDLVLDYGYELREEGKWHRALRVYADEFAANPSWGALRGLLLSLFPRYDREL